jgi:hypothetical protein
MVWRAAFGHPGHGANSFLRPWQGAGMIAVVLGLATLVQAQGEFFVRRRPRGNPSKLHRGNMSIRLAGASRRADGSLAGSHIG